MFIIDDIYDEGKKIIGMCDDLKFFRWCADAVTLVANKADLEGWKMFLDVCTTGCSCTSASPCNKSSCGRKCVTMPREIQTVLAVNIGGRPTLGFSQTFEWHLNGPGSGNCGGGCDFSWMDGGAWHSTYRDLVVPSQLVVHSQLEEDNGKTFIVHGYDSQGNKLTRSECNQQLDGIRLPVIFGYAIPSSSEVAVARITAIFKDHTSGSLRLSTVDSNGTSGVNLGVYEPDERVPQFRRIILNHACDWVRVSAIKSNPSFSSRFDRVPLQSRVGFLMAMQARKAYSALQLAEAHAYEADAARMELEAQQKLEPPLYAPIQIIDRAGSLRDKGDFDIV